MRTLGLAGAALCLGLLAACQAPAVRNYHSTAERLGFAELLVAGDGFVHRAYLNRAALAGDIRRLHVYIDGDGTAWRGPGRPALDPTGRDPLVLRLMAQDPAAALYLGRPCYLGVDEPDSCQPWYWTHGRYSRAVVGSMTAALSSLLQHHPAGELTLIGYSGGGTLAMLMAARLTDVSEVVTLAANLDVQAWTDEHGYSPLIGSLNPATQAPLPARIRQWHWVGKDDAQVPPRVVEQGLLTQTAPHFEVLPDMDHGCCWEREWPRLLNKAVNDSQGHPTLGRGGL